MDPDKTDDPLLLIVNTANQQEYNRKWSIRIRQIPCKSQYRGKFGKLFKSYLTDFDYLSHLAPPGCLQYYTGLAGNVESFNYRTTNLPVTTSTTAASVIAPADLKIANNYLNNLNYGVCVARQPRMCAIKWQAIDFDFGGSLVGSSTPSENCASGQGTLSADGDYFLIPFGTDQTKSHYSDRFCGQRFSSAVTQSTTNTDVYCK